MGEVSVGIRIGELSQRLGVSTHLLRAWERRYGLFTPMRSVGGYRLYGPEDERRARQVLELINDGTPASAAAASVLAQSHLDLPDTRSRRHAVVAAAFSKSMFAAVARFDEAAAEAALDNLLNSVSLGAAIDDGLMPFFADIGRLWEAHNITIAQEHFIAALVRRRLLALTLPRGSSGPLAVLACPAGELHDLPLVFFATLLSRSGWRVRQLGANTPISDIASAAEGASAIVVAATKPSMFRRDLHQLRELATRVPVALAGRGADEFGEFVVLPPKQSAALETLNSLL